VLLERRCESKGSVWPYGGVIRVCICLYLLHVLGLGWAKLAVTTLR